MYRNRKLQLVAVLVLGLSMITVFQNCAPISFSAEEISLNSSSSSVEAVKSQGPALCQSVGHLEFNLSFDQSKTYSCYDQTAQAAPTGPVCTAGPVVTKFTESASLAQDCLALTVCGTKAREIVEVEGTDKIKKFRFVYDNLPMGCSGSIKIKTLSDQASNESKTEDSAILKVSIPVASCNTCADGVTKTCGACPVNPPGPSVYSWRTGSFGSCSAAPSYTYGSWGACVSGQQTRSAVCLNTAGSQSRTVSCVNSSGAVVSDSFCSAAKPASSQSCTSACSGSAVTTQTCVTQGCDRTELVTLYNQSVTTHTAQIENFAQNCVDSATSYEQMMAGEGQTRFMNTCAVRWCSKIFGTLDAIGLVTNQITNTGSGYAAGQMLQVECRTNLKYVPTSNEVCKQIVQNKPPLVWFVVSYSEATACGGSPEEAIGIYYSDSARSACATNYCLNKNDGYKRGFLTEVSPTAKSIVCSRAD